MGMCVWGSLEPSASKREVTVDSDVFYVGEGEAG